MIPKATISLVCVMAGCGLLAIPKPRPAPIPQVTETTAPAPASMKPASTVAEPQDVAVVAVPSEQSAGTPAAFEHEATTTQVAFNSPACATCSPAYRPQPAIQPRQYQPQTRRGILGGRFRR